MSIDLPPEAEARREQYRAKVMEYVTGKAIADTGIVYHGGFDDEPESKNVL